MLEFLFLIKLRASPRPQHSCFPVNIVKFLRTPILKNIRERLLLEDADLYKDTFFLNGHKKIFKKGQNHKFLNKSPRSNGEVSKFSENDLYDIN